MSYGHYLVVKTLSPKAWERFVVCESAEFNCELASISQRADRVEFIKPQGGLYTLRVEFSNQQKVKMAEPLLDAFIAKWNKKAEQ